MRLTHQTLVDPDLPHQVNFVVSHSSMHIQVTCNCRVARTKKSMGKSSNLEQARELYNNPDNHLIPFDPEKDRAKW